MWYMGKMIHLLHSSFCIQTKPRFPDLLQALEFSNLALCYWQPAWTVQGSAFHWGLQAALATRCFQGSRYSLSARSVLGSCGRCYALGTNSPRAAGELVFLSWALWVHFFPCTALWSVWERISAGLTELTALLLDSSEGREQTGFASTEDSRKQS